MGMNAAVPIPRQPGFRIVGDNPVRLFGLTAGERAGRFAAKAGIAATSAGDGAVVLANLDYACDPAWFAAVRDRPGHVLTLGGAPVLAHALNAEAASAIEAAMRGGDLELPPSHVAWPAEAAGGLHSAALRKKEAPFVLRLTPHNADAAERASLRRRVQGRHRCPDLVPVAADRLHLTRWSAQAGLSPNFITAVGRSCARRRSGCSGSVTTGRHRRRVRVHGARHRRWEAGAVHGTSSKWGNVFDHGIDLIHPPFWWWAWLHGLDAYGTPLASDTANMALAVIVGGYVLQRVIEGVFMRRFGMHIHVWQQIDSQFRLITARRNP
jgi:hypothetical protein